MTVIRPLHAPLTQAPSAQPAARATGSSFAQRLQGSQTTGQSAQASQTVGHSLDDGSRPLSPQELQEELRSVSLQQGLMMGQRLLAMNNGGPALERE